MKFSGNDTFVKKKGGKMCGFQKLKGVNMFIIKTP